MPEQETPVLAEPVADTPPAPRRKAKRGRALAYWLAAAGLYVGMGLWKPQLVFLGFQQAFVYVLVVTLLAPIVIRRLP